jgi:hypothetical protein
MRFNNFAFWSLFIGILFGFLKFIFIVMNNVLVISILTWVSYLFYILSFGLGIYSLVKKEEKAWIAYLTIFLSVAINYKLFL